MSVYLDKVVIYNFKSFRGEVVFSPVTPFTAIVGPNGSGKSNLMDAISFAMGERASNLRVKQLSDLIHGAAVGKPTAHSARVTAVFALTDGSRKSFTRTIRGASCEYKINNEVVSARPYVSELDQLGLNVKTKNFLVFQGAVESIVMKNPKELSQLVEEISTSGELKAEYDRLTELVNKADNDVRYMNQMKKDILAKKNCAILEKKDADQYEALNKRYLKMKTELLLFELFHLKAAMRNLEVEAVEKEKAIDDYENDKELAESLYKQKKGELQTMSRDLAEVEQDLAEVENVFRTKEADFVTVQERVSFWRRKFDSTNALLENARKAHEAHAKTINELRNELQQVEEMKILFVESTVTQLASQGSSAELSNSQVEEYLRLKKVVQVQSLEYMRSCDLLKGEQSRDQDRLDNEERKKNELEDKLNQKRIMEDEMKRRFARLRDFVKETTEQLRNKRNMEIDMQDTIRKRKDRVETIQNELQEVHEQLGDATLQNDVLSRMKKKAETIKTLKKLYKGVHGRLSDLCRPVHPRYNIAVAKVFGKHMDAIVVDTTKVAILCISYLREQRRDVEVFLPLDNLKVKPVKEKLRDIQQPRNVKPLYDVLQFGPENINRAILFVTKNTLVCETPEDASTMAYDVGPQYKNDCVSIDGTFYRKDGTLSGGQAELSKRAKVWEEAHLSELKLKKAQLTEELKHISKIPQAESDLNTIESQIRGLESRLKYSQYSLSDTKNQIASIEIQIADLENKLQPVCNSVASIKAAMEERNLRIRSIETEMNNIEGMIFEEFCRRAALTSIRQYECGDLRVQQEQARRRMELEEQCNRIENLLEFELQRDTQSAISKYKATMKSAEENLAAVCQVEAANGMDIAIARRNLEEQRAACKTIKDKVSDLEESVNECRNRLRRIARLILDAEREHVMTLMGLEKKKAEWHAILKDCKTEGIPIPLLGENRRSNDTTIQSSSQSQPSLSTVEFNEQEMISLVDFSKLPESLKSNVEEDIRSFRMEITSEIVKIQSTMESIRDPNLKANEKLNLATEELRRTTVEAQELRKRASTVKQQFEQLKQERCKRFANCMDHIVAEVDVIYKCLVGDESAQAILLKENSEEPYLGGITYSCIAPGKRFQPLSNLSGGEKTLVALALLLAIHRPAPFFVLDEIDASLDNLNIRNVVRFIRAKTSAVQFIIISLKKELFMHADALVGISLDPNSECPESSMFTLGLSQYVVVLRK